ncbi:snapalysin family zinc-dependent metalloprotease [Micromonospora sp. DR5-3]|uniref:snapalysin family zinc-dependent metalloprotease n=1 Tax=unclassified Micromonospora TaxID=2617518 RepID=UPI0011D31F43|nr:MULTISPECIES: snapalysin family zinc-dependent metalloprotease [unclassified Micromonospora]MCW3819339.1 snapalysin family zinc-dependent metalloprotease [Micromonospora sp. DR5-3]TYC21774.1 snapalysin family zinc-dependent metalloprotease [Micromonospora sp. MP36]
MRLPRMSRILATLAAATVAALGVVAVESAPASAAVRNVCYNTSQAGPFAGYANQAATIWNNATNNINMAPCGSNLMIYYTYGGGSYAVRYSLGNGYVVIDYYQAQQYSPLRIMTHEIGHILGLADNYNGNCAILMSGGSAGTSCTNPYPSAGEAAAVDSYFSFATRGATTAQVFTDSWPAAAAVLR